MLLPPENGEDAMSTQASPKRSKTESVSATTRPQKASALGSGTVSTGNVNIFLFTKESIGFLRASNNTWLPSL